MTYTLRNSEADELHFVQSGHALFKTEFGTIEAGPLDFVCIPRAMGYRVARLDTGSRQPHAQAFYEAAGYRRTGNFNDNPAAAFHGEKRLD